MSPLNAIEAAYFEELVAQDAVQAKEMRLREFQRNLKARIAAKKLQDINDANEKKIKEAEEAAVIKSKCRSMFVPKTRKAQQNKTVKQSSRNVKNEISNRNAISIKSAKSKLNSAVESDSMEEPVSVLPPAVTVVDCSLLQDETENITRPHSSRQNSNEIGLTSVAQNRNLTRKAIMMIERERAHERAKLKERKKRMTAQNQTADETLDLNLEFASDQSVESITRALEDSQESNHQLTARSAITYTVKSYNDKDDNDISQPHSSKISEYSERCSSKEKERFSDALKRSVKEQLDAKNMIIPPLCSCSGESFWSLKTENCAVNCPFYRNRKLYDRIMKAVVKSYDINPNW